MAKKLTEKTQKVTISIPKGEVITLKKGMLQESVMVEGQAFLVRKAEYLGDGRWRTIEREEVELVKDDLLELKAHIIKTVDGCEDKAELRKILDEWVNDSSLAVVEEED